MMTRENKFFIKLVLSTFRYAYWSTDLEVLGIIYQDEKLLF